MIVEFISVLTFTAPAPETRDCHYANGHAPQYEVPAKPLFIFYMKEIHKIIKGEDKLRSVEQVQEDEHHDDNPNQIPAEMPLRSLGLFWSHRWFWRWTVVSWHRRHVRFP